MLRANFPNNYTVPKSLKTRLITPKRPTTNLDFQFQLLAWAVTNFFMKLKKLTMKEIIKIVLLEIFRYSSKPSWLNNASKAVSVLVSDRAKMTRIMFKNIWLKISIESSILIALVRCSSNFHKSSLNLFLKKLYTLWHPFLWRLWRTGILLLTKSKGHKSNVHCPGFPNYPQTKSSLHISICQSKLKHKCLPLDTL